MPATLQRQVGLLVRQAWPSERPPSTGPTHDPALVPQSLLLLDGEQVLAALVILSKEITHGGTQYQASGLSTVVTDLAVQRRGFGLRLVRDARERIAASGADLGLFTCDRGLEGFYARAGWQLLPGTVLVGGTPEAPFASDQFDKVTMGDFFSPHARTGAASFLDARVALYPGPIDKLW